MKIIDLFSQVEAMRPSAYENNTKLIWLNEVEGIIQNEVFLFSDEDFIVYGENDLECEPLLDRGFEKIYRAYLMAMISLTDGEFKRYQNDMQIFNRYYSDFCTYYKTRNTAAAGYSTAYVSAYAIAVKHGLFSGDEAAFITFLKGEKGDNGKDGTDGKDGEDGKDGADGKDGEDGKDGADAELVFYDETLYQRKASGDTPLMNMGDLRGEALSKAVSDAQSAKSDAEKSALLAQEAAEEIKNTAVGANQIVATAKGSAILLSDSADSPIIEAKIYGKTTQPTNLLSNIAVTTTVSCGVEITVTGSRTITLRGTATASQDVYLSGCPSSLENDVSYSLFAPSMLVIENQMNPVIDYIVGGSSGAFVVPNMILAMLLKLEEGVTYDESFTPVLLKTGESSELTSVENPSIKFYGKNLIKYPYINTTKTQEGVAYTDNGDGTITIKGTPSGYSDFKLCYFYEKGKFTIGGVDTYNNVSIGIVLQDVNQNTIATINKQQNQPKITFDTSEYPDYYRGLVQIKRNANNIAIDTVIRPQIEVGELATEYETYKAPQALSFMGYSLCGIKDSGGNWVTRDEIAYDGESVKHIQRLSENSGALTVLTAPIETDITDTEAGQALRSLHTHYPTTTVISDTDVSITYVADTKNYIDNKINELAAAIVAQ